MTGVGALFDSSKQLINGPTNAISIAVLSALAAFPETDRVQLAIVLAFLVGAVQMGITLLRLGDLTRFVSHAVIVGFTLGAACLIVLDQFKNLLGIRTYGTGEDHFLKRFWLTIKHIDETNRTVLCLGLGADRGRAGDAVDQSAAADSLTRTALGGFMHGGRRLDRPARVAMASRIIVGEIPARASFLRACPTCSGTACGN